MRIKVFRIITVCMLMFWMLLIFFMSSQTAAESSATSGGFLRILLNFIYPKFKVLDSSAQLEIINQFTFFIRKAAHFTLYAILGIFSYCAIITYNKFSYKVRYCSCFLLCVLYAISDEIHQYFIPGRSCEFRDVLIDSK